MRRMDRIWLSIGLALVWQGAAFAGGIDGLQLISQQHHVWGFAGSATDWQPGGTEVQYDQTSSDPLDVSVEGTYIDFLGYEDTLTARSKAGDFRVDATAEYWFSKASAKSIYTFSPQPDVYAVAVNAQSGGFGVGEFDETNVWFSFDDLTAGIQVAGFTAPVTADWDDQPDVWGHILNGTYSVDPMHTYSMSLFAAAGIGDDGRDAWLDVTVQPVVPVPGAAILAVLGTSFVGLLRKRRTL